MQREPRFAQFCLTCTVLLSSYPSGKVFFFVGVFCLFAVVFCQKQDDFPATGTASVDRVGGSQKREASNRSSLASFSRHAMPENQTTAQWNHPREGANTAGSLELNLAKELKGAENTVWI